MKSKKLVVAIVASAMLSLAPMPSLAEDKIKLTEETGIVYKLTEKQGLEQLAKLAAEGKKEDGWYYIPAREEWIDHGAKVSAYSYVPKVSVILNKDIEEVITCHIHPSHSLLETKIKGYMPPSYEDLWFTWQEMKTLKEKGIEITKAWAVDWGGYWSVDLETSNMKQFEKEYSRLQFSKKYDKLIDRHEKMLEKHYKLNKDNKMYRLLENVLIADCEEEFARLGINVKYHYFD